MNEAAAEFMEQWLEANVAHRHVEQPSPRDLALLSARCLADSRAAGISLESIEAIVGDIEEAITDEMQFQAAMASKTPRH